MNKKKWFDIIKLVVPIIVATTVPGAGPVLAGLIIHGIDVAENKGGSGATKLDIAKEEISTAITGINAVKPGTVNAAQADAVVTSIINASIGTANLINNVPVK